MVMTMTNAPFLLPLDPVHEQPGTDSIKEALTHQSVTKTTFLLYFPKAGATLAA